MAALIPNPVTGLSQDSNQYKIGTITMKWNKVSTSGTPTLYYILTRDGGGIIYQGINTTFTDTNLIPGQSYNY